MMILKCTAEVRKAIGLPQKQLADTQSSTAPLGHWYVHRFAIGKTLFLLFMSEPTLLSFVLRQGRRPLDAYTLPDMFLAGLQQLLSLKGMGAAAIARTMAPCHTGLFGKTDSRKALGSMNDLIRCYTVNVEAQGGLASCNLTDIIMRLNDMPQRRLDWATSWDVARAQIERATAPD